MIGCTVAFNSLAWLAVVLLLASVTIVELTVNHKRAHPSPKLRELLVWSGVVGGWVDGRFFFLLSPKPALSSRH